MTEKFSIKSRILPTNNPKYMIKLKLVVKLIPYLPPNSIYFQTILPNLKGSKKPVVITTGFLWAQKDLNLRPSDYESAALTS